MMLKPKNVNKGVTLCLPDAAGTVDRSKGIVWQFKDLFHLCGMLAHVGTMNPHVTPAIKDLFRRPCFVPGRCKDGVIKAAEAEGLALSVAVFDVDVNVTPATIALLDTLPFELCYFTTRSFGPDDIHLRLLLAINRPIRSKHELRVLTEHIDGRLGGTIHPIKNLNHLHDVPLAASAIVFREGRTFDVEGLIAAHAMSAPFAAEGVAAAHEGEDAMFDDDDADADADTPKKQGGPTAILRHFENIVVKQLQRIETMESGARHDTCASVGAICGAAYHGALAHGVQPQQPEDMVIDIIAGYIQRRGYERSDEAEFIDTVREQFTKWGAAHPFDKMGLVDDTLTAAMIALHERSARRKRPTPTPAHSPAPPMLNSAERLALLRLARIKTHRLKEMGKET